MNDKILENLVNRNMRNIAINHAKKRMIEISGVVDEKIICDLENIIDSKELWSVVVILYGDPIENA